MKKNIKFHIDISQYFKEQDLELDIPNRLSQPFEWVIVL